MTGYRRHYATSTPTRDIRADMKVCPRCGLERKGREGASLCGSCRSTTTPAEWEVWAA